MIQVYLYAADHFDLLDSISFLARQASARTVAMGSLIVRHSITRFATIAYWARVSRMAGIPAFVARPLRETCPKPWQW